MRTVTFGLSNPALANPGFRRHAPLEPQSAIAEHKADQFNRASRHLPPQFGGGNATQATSAPDETAASERQGRHTSPDTLEAYQQRVTAQINQLSIHEVHQQMNVSRYRLRAYMDEIAGRHDPRAAQEELRPYIAHEVILQQQLQARIRQDNIQKVVKFLMMGVALGLVIWHLIKPLFTQRQQPAASN